MTSPELLKLAQRPGSDINTQGLEICHLGQSHFLAVNGFSSYRPHFLLLTLDGYRRQSEPLDIDDFTAAHAFLEGREGDDYMVFFNCKVEAGCSRTHKHLQAIPKESFHGKPWVNLDENKEALPFEFFQEKQGPSRSPEASLKIYQTGLEAVERTLGKKTTKEDGAPPHNMIMDKGRIVVIPRRQAGIDPLGANSGGMLGTIWIKSEETMRQWLDIGPRKLLENAGAPKLL